MTEREERRAMRDLANDIDFTSGTLRVELHGERASLRGSKLKITDDLTWTNDGDDVVIRHLVVYGEVRVRDWRWLWLRRRPQMIGPVMLPLEAKTLRGDDP